MTWIETENYMFCVEHVLYVQRQGPATVQLHFADGQFVELTGQHADDFCEYLRSRLKMKSPAQARKSSKLHAL